MNPGQIQEHDVNAIRDYLASYDLFAGNEAEGQSYINLALQRFLITLSMIPPAAQPGIAAAVSIVTGYFAPRRVLDVGCAKGFLVDALRRRNIDAWGIDFSPYAIQCGPAVGQEVCSHWGLRADRQAEQRVRPDCL